MMLAVVLAVSMAVVLGSAPGERQVGGETATDINNPDVQAALNYAVERINAMSNSLFLMKSVQVEKVTSQVVSGISFHFTGVKMAATDCNKMASHDLSNCNVADGGFTQTCEFKVWWQSWLTPQYQLNNFHCQ